MCLPAIGSSDPFVPVVPAHSLFRLVYLNDFAGLYCWLGERSAFA